MEPFIGEIRMFSWNWAPEGFALCNGTTLQISQNQALAALLGNTYGGDRVKTFNLPDLRGRTPVMEGADPNISHTYALGEKGGTDAVTLTSAQVPIHSHQVGAITDPGNAVTPGLPSQKGANVFATVAKLGTNPTAAIYYTPPAGTTPTVALQSSTVSTAGGGSPHSNMQPYTTTNFCIATLGLWPPRQ